MITDHDCPKSAFFIPTHKTADTWEIANLYVQNIFPHYGIPKKIISNQDLRYTSKVAKEICDILRINQNISTAFHPQTDGQSERTNQSLQQYLCLFCNDKQSNWHAWLPIAQYTRNSWPNVTTKKTPFDLLIGYTPQAHQPSRAPTLPNIETRLKNINDARKTAQEAQSKAQASWIKENPRYHEYETGTQVWLEGTNLKLPEGMTKKLSPRRYGPFRVVAKISPIAYTLELPPQWKIHPTFHASLLTPYKETSQHGPNFVEPPPDIVNREEEWEIEQITNTCLHGRWKKRQYLVRWKGYSPAHDQWINEEDMNAPDLIKAFQDNHPDKFQLHQRTKTPLAIKCTRETSDSVNNPCPPFLPPSASEGTLSSSQTDLPYQEHHAEQASSVSKLEEATRSTISKETLASYESTLEESSNPSGSSSRKPSTRQHWQPSGLSGTTPTTPGLDQTPQNTTGQRHPLLNNSQKASPTSSLQNSSPVDQENLDDTTGLTSTLDYTGFSANTKPTAHITANKLMTSSPSYLSTTRPKRNDSPRPPLTLFERIGPPVDPENISPPVSPSPLPIPPRVFTPIRGLIRATENTPDPLIPLSNPAPLGNVDDIASTYSFEPPEDWTDHFPSGPDRVDLVKTLLAHILEWWKQKGIPNQTSATEQAVVENARWYLEAEKGDIDPETENFKAVERVCHYYSDLLGDALLPVAPEQPPSLQARIHTPETSPTPSSESSVISVKTTKSDRDMEKPTGWGWFEYNT